jgi:CHASE3 domain sensor protein/GGDEF domain-containing protein
MNTPWHGSRLESPPLERQVAWLFAFLVAAVLIAAAITISSRVDYDLFVERHQASDERQDALRALLKTVADAESGVYGFVLSGRAHHLDAFHSADEQRGLLFLHLEKAFESNDEVATVSTIERLSGRRLTELAAIVRTARSVGLQAAQTQATTDGGERTMAEMRGLIEGLRAHEAERSDQIAAQLHTSRTITTAAELCFAAATIGLGLAAFRRLRAVGRNEASTRAQIGMLLGMDAATGLATHQHLVGEVRRAIARAGRAGRSLAVLSIVLDGAGQARGTPIPHLNEEDLRRLASSLTQTVREGDLPAGLAASRFGVLAEEIGKDVAQRMAARIAQALEGAVPVDEAGVAVTVRTGCVVYPDDGADAGALVALAEALATRPGARCGAGSEN